MFRHIALHIDSSCQRYRQIRFSLEPLGFKLHRAPTIPIASMMMKKHYYPLFIINFAAASEETFKFCSRVRSKGVNALIIVLTDNVTMAAEERLFDSGANDVVTGKQASPRILIKRIEAHLRNSKLSWMQTHTIKLKDTVIDLARREVWCKGRIRPLPGILTDLLRYFLDNPDRVISREELQQSTIWADSICTPAAEGGKTFDVNMSKLRKIIEPDACNPQIIKSVRGVGWMLARDCIG